MDAHHIVDDDAANSLPADVRELLDSSVDSVDSLDALLLLNRDPSRDWMVEDVAHAIGVDASSAQHVLAELKRRGLATEIADGKTFRMAALTPLSLNAFTALSNACANNRTAVVGYLSRRTIGRLSVLAMAFTRGNRR